MATLMSNQEAKAQFNKDKNSAWDVKRSKLGIFKVVTLSVFISINKYDHMVKWLSDGDYLFREESYENEQGCKVTLEMTCYAL